MSEVDDILAAMYAEEYGENDSAKAESSGSDASAAASSAQQQATATGPTASTMPSPDSESNNTTVGDSAIWNSSVRLPSDWRIAHQALSSQANLYGERLMQSYDNVFVISGKEVWRAKSIAFLRGKFDKICGQIFSNLKASASSSAKNPPIFNNQNPSLSPSQSFERWIFNCKFSEVMDLPLPTKNANRILVSELQSCGARKHAAIDTVRRLRQFTKRAITTAKRSAVATSKRISVSQHVTKGEHSVGTDVRHSNRSGSGSDLIVLSFGKTKVKITLDHFVKLLRMYRLVSDARKSDNRDDHGRGKRKHSSNSYARQFSFLPTSLPAPSIRELDAIFAVVLRYNTLVGPQTQGAGFQAALSGECFDSLLLDFGCRMECFASPLNSRYRNFCSAFPETDRPFGSLGSFFDFFPERGSYEANPPFVDSVIYKMAQHMRILLEKASAAREALQFVVIIPAWPLSRGWKAIYKGCNPFMKRHVRIAQRDHGYTEGAQWSKSGSRFRISTCDTSVFFLQTEAAARQWPTTDEACDRLTKSFRSKHALQSEIRGNRSSKSGESDSSVLDSHSRSNSSSSGSDGSDGSDDENVMKKRKVH